MSTLGDLEAPMAVLGLLIEQPDTGSGLAVRLDELFPRARWPRNVVHNTVPGLLRQGLIRVTSRHASDTVSPNGYEATEDGVAEFRRWIRASAALPPMLRDELQGKLEFSTEDDLRVLVDELSVLETACAAEFATARNLQDQASRMRQRMAKHGRRPDWARRIRELRLADEAIVWGQRGTRLKEVREHIEDVLAEVEGGADAAGGADG
ncbi:MAG TPA: hypothetical protein VMS02_00230 [Solirubrobacteraceae bacterium]|nr:hypothetical protein [Solirubrobacteraceae bacterium]